MPRVPLSTVCEAIEDMYPQVTKGGDLRLIYGMEQQVSLLLALVDSVPEELLLLPSEEYARLIAARETLRTALDMWKVQGASAPPPVAKTPGLSPRSPVTLIYHALKLCPDQLALRPKRAGFH